jgi:hypothetical protein
MPQAVCSPDPAAPTLDPTCCPGAGRAAADGTATAGQPYGKEFARYRKAAFRLRVLTTGGFSPDGVTGLRPDMYEDFFRLHAKGKNGKTVMFSSRRRLPPRRRPQPLKPDGQRLPRDRRPAPRRSFVADGR